MPQLIFDPTTWGKLSYSPLLAVFTQTVLLPAETFPVLRSVHPAEHHCRSGGWPFTAEGIHGKRVQALAKGNRVINTFMNTSKLYQAYNSCPEHMHSQATSGMSFRTLRIIKLSIALLASAQKTSLTKVILAAVGAYLDKHRSVIDKEAQKQFGKPLAFL